MELVKFNEAYHAIMVAKTVDEVKEIRDKAEALRTYLRQQGASLEMQNACAEISLRASRRAGEILKEMPKNKGLNGTIVTDNTVLPVRDDTPTLAEIGLTKSQSSRFQSIASIPELVFEQTISEAKNSKDELTSSQLLKLARDLKRQEAKQEAREQMTTTLPGSITVLNGDYLNCMASLKNNSVSLIFTDPPYDREHVPCYGQLAKEAARVLKPNGSLIAYAGHYALPQILADMSQYLRYWWMIALKHNGSNAKLPGKWVFVGYKPLVWFVKGGRSNENYVRDLFEDSRQPNKVLHEWEQDMSEATYYIEQLTELGELIVDPFLGSGTTLAAAHALGRQGWGCDIDKDRADVARKRLAQ